MYNAKVIPGQGVSATPGACGGTVFALSNLTGPRQQNGLPPTGRPGCPILSERLFLMGIIDKWKVQDAAEVYGIRHWGKGYFGINKSGHVTVHPNKRPEQAI